MRQGIVTPGSAGLDGFRGFGGRTGGAGEAANVYELERLGGDAALQNYELAPRDLLVLVDEIELPLGMLRIRPRGSAGGHKGLKSIIGALQVDDFIRLRMGVGPEWPVEDYVSYLLRPFRPAQTASVAEMLDLASEAVRVILSEGVQKAMNRFNRRVPPSES